MIRREKIYLLTLLLGLASCGFSDGDSDPLDGREDSEYASSAEKKSEKSANELKFEQESQAYKDSLAKVKAEQVLRETRMKKNYQDFVASQNKKSSGQEANWKKSQAEQLKIFNAYKSDAEKSIANQNIEMAKLVDRIQEYEKTINELEPQEFDGQLHKFSAPKIKAESFVFTQGEQGEYEFDFELPAKPEAFKGIIRKGDLPEGLKIDRKSPTSNTYVISGIPTVEVKAGEVPVEKEITVEADIDLDKFPEPKTKEKIDQYDSTHKILIVVRPSVQPPVLNIAWPDKENMNVIKSDLEIEIYDPASVDSDLAPVVQFNFSNAGTTKNITTVNGATLITQNPEVKENPRKVKGKKGHWIYAYVFHRDLFSMQYPILAAEKNKKFQAQFQLVGQSQITGRPSVSQVHTVKLTGAK